MTNRERPRVAVFGEWNTANLGDRAIYEGAVEFFDGLGWDTVAIGIGTLTPASDPGSREVVEPARPPPGAGGLRSAAYKGARRLLRPYRQRIRAGSLAPEVANTDVAVIGGGALLSDRRRHFSQSLRALSPVLGRLRIPTVCLGCSMESEWTRGGRKALSSFLRSCDIVAPRDSETARRVEAILRRPAPVFGDFALTLPLPSPGRRPRNTLGLNISALVSTDPEEQRLYEARLVSIARTYLEADPDPTRPKVRIFTTGTPEDTAPAERVLAQLPSSTTDLVFPRDLPHLRRVLRSTSVVVASRLHAAILSLAEGTPAIGLATTPKIPRFLETVGLGEFAMNLDVARDPSAVTGLLIDDSLGVRQQQAASGPIESTRARVRDYFRTIAKRRISE